jgi:hypothetical protein
VEGSRCCIVADRVSYVHLQCTCTQCLRAMMFCFLCSPHQHEYVHVYATKCAFDFLAELSRYMYVRATCTYSRFVSKVNMIAHMKASYKVVKIKDMYRKWNSSENGDCFAWRQDKAWRHDRKSRGTIHVPNVEDAPHGTVFHSPCAVVWA